MNVKNMFYGAILVSAVWAVILLSWFESSLTLSDYLSYESVILIPCLLCDAVYGLGKRYHQRTSNYPRQRLFLHILLISLLTLLTRTLCIALLAFCYNLSVTDFLIHNGLKHGNRISILIPQCINEFCVVYFVVENESRNIKLEFKCCFPYG